MKINLTKRIYKDKENRDFLMHIVLNCLTDQITKELTKDRIKGRDIEVEIILTLNGHELDLEKFMKYWQSRVNRIIKEEAKELINEKFLDLNDLFSDLQEKLRIEVDKRMKDWEREKKNENTSTGAFKINQNKRT